LRRAILFIAKSGDRFSLVSRSIGRSAFSVCRKEALDKTNKVRVRVRVWSSSNWTSTDPHFAIPWMEPDRLETADSQIPIRESNIDWLISADRQRRARFRIRKNSICLRRRLKNSLTSGSKRA
jgi:hypothetical protein